MIRRALRGAGRSLAKIEPGDVVVVVGLALQGYGFAGFVGVHEAAALVGVELVALALWKDR